MNIFHCSNGDAGSVLEAEILSEEHKVFSSNMLRLSELPRNFIKSDCIYLDHPSSIKIFACVAFSRIFSKTVVFNTRKCRFLNMEKFKTKKLFSFLTKILCGKNIKLIITSSAEQAFTVRGISALSGISLAVIRPFSEGSSFNSQFQNGIIVLCDLSKYSIYEKNLPLVILLAQNIPELHFYILIKGQLSKDMLEFFRCMPPNCHFISENRGRNFDWIICRTSIYLDVSEYGRDNSGLVRAMSHGLIPVITDVGILPEIAGKYGYIVSLADGADSLTEQIRSITANVKTKSGEVAAHIHEQRSFEKFRFSLLNSFKDKNLGLA